MNNNFYMHPQKENWYGRIDGDDYDSFRWHQIIECVSYGDLVEANVNFLNFAIIGYDVDHGIVRNSGRSGAGEGPLEVRKSLANKPCTFSQKVRLFDLGDIVCIDGDLETAQNTLTLVTNKALDLGYFPIVIGGGHDLAYADLMAVTNHLSTNPKFKLGIINFDAHFDVRPSGISTSGTSFRQIYDHYTANNYSYNHLTIGVQKSANTKVLFNFIDGVKSQYILARDIDVTQKSKYLKVLEDFVDSNDYIYISVCTDVFSSAFAPGVSSPQPLGINPELFIEMLKLILVKKKTVMFDIAEISPPLDISYATVSLGSLIIYTLITAIWENY